MASGPLVGGGGGGGGGDGSREKHRWAENKVYTRKSQKSSAQSSNKPLSQQQHPPQPPLSSQQTPATTTDDANSSLQQPAPDNHHPQQQLPRFDLAASDDASSLNDNSHRHHPPVANNSHSNGRRPLVSLQKLENGSGYRVVINLTPRPRREVRELRRKLTEELEEVRAFVKKIQAREVELAASTGPVATGYSQSQLSVSDTHHVANAKRSKANSEAASAGPLRRQLSVSVATAQLDTNSMGEAVEKEKRTPKANQYYRNSEFLLGKEKFPPPDSHKKSKTNGSKKHHSSGDLDYGMPVPDKKLYAQAFKSCQALLSKLMKHKHGWVFNTPVDVKALGLHDYYSIIKQPMDLGTVRSRLNKNWYKSPGEFAEDVRLTFRNAMTYNPKGQDVHVMAEQLSGIFEEQWPTVEAEYAFPSYPMASKKVPLPLDRRILERSDSTTHPVVPDLKSKPVSYTSHVGRPPSLKKPKAKDPHKREMTYEEKQRLSNNLQNLPSEKLDNVVQIIKKRNSSLSQHDDEIEVDIDSVDIETLWELDRFVTNYKKSLSKNKRKRELAILARAEAEQNVQERNLVPSVMEPPKESVTVTTNQQLLASPLPVAAEKKADNVSRSSSSSSSSSGSGSSSSDSDSESSSAYGSDAGHSPRT